MIATDYTLRVRCSKCPAVAEFTDRVPTFAADQATDAGWRIDRYAGAGEKCDDRCPRHADDKADADTRQYRVECDTCMEDCVGSLDECEGFTMDHRCWPEFGPIRQVKAAGVTL